MNEQEVNRQIHQMVQFIKQEAEEKANEIRVAAEEVRPRALFFAPRHRRDLTPRPLPARPSPTGVQHREAAGGGGGEAEDPKGVRAQGEPGRGQEEDVRLRVAGSLNLAPWLRSRPVRAPPQRYPDIPFPHPTPSNDSQYSTELNAMRLKVLAARDEAIQGLLAEARASLAG